MSSDEEERALKKQIFKDPVEIQKARLERLMNNMEKPVFIPERKDIKAPRAFQPHEFVRNVMGASAGAGSGEFDIYRGCRRRQMIREAYLNREAKEREANEEWVKKIETNKEKAESQTAKRRQKRLKRKQKGKNKKRTTNKNSNQTDESTSSSSEDESDEKPNSETDGSNAPASNTEENQTVKELPRSSPPPAPQVKHHEKTDVRKHIRNRQTNSSDDEETEKKIETTS